MTFLIRPRMLLVILCVLTFQVAARQKPSFSIQVEFRLAEISKSDGLIEATVKDSGLRIYLHKTERCLTSRCSGAREQSFSMNSNVGRATADLHR